MCFQSRRHLRHMQKSCASRNCGTNAHIKFIFDTINDPEWKKFEHAITLFAKHPSTSYLT